MSRAGAAQEPSMDEILASIRRIIETGEDRLPPAKPGRGNQSETDQPERSDSVDDADLTLSPLASPQSEGSLPQSGSSGSESRAAEVVDFVSPFARGWSGVTTSAFEREQPREEQPTLADFEDDSDLAAELEQQLAAAYERSQLAPTAEAPKAEAGGIPTFEPVADEMPVSYHTEDEDAEAGEDAVVARREEPDQGFRGPTEPANSDERPASQHQGIFMASRPAFIDEPQHHLLSEEAGGLVVASFEELAQAIRAGEIRSLEAMAQDMMRPMLQEWLDDNLPRMVERLVREEIERMARGGRR